MAVSTLGEAYDLGWRIIIACDWGKRDGMKTIRECNARIDADLPTLLWTRGRDFPLIRLEGRLKCPRCGSRRVRVMFEAPTNSRMATRA
jgi:hypothetical protein